ncbi:glycosyltransferase [Vibrio breoganii]
MKILVLTSMYPSKEKKYNGIFVKEQVDALSNEFNIHADVLDLSIYSSSLSRYILSSFKILKTIIYGKPDIVHVHYGLTAFPLLILFPYIKLSGINIVTTFHGSDVLGSNKAVKLISQLTMKLYPNAICVSRQIYEKVNAKNKIYLPCGVDNMFINNRDDEERKYILFGGDPDRLEKDYSRFEKIISNTTIPKDKIKVLKNLTRLQVRETLLKAKCLVLTSKHEGSPQIVKESIGCNTPIISTPVGDVPMLVDNLEHSFTSDDNCSLSLKIEKLYKSDVKCDYTENVKYFSQSLTMNKLLDFYKSIV